MLMEAIKLLSVYLVDDDVPLIRMSQEALRQILRSQQGIETLKLLDDLQKSYIKHLAHSKRETTVPDAALSR